MKLSIQKEIFKKFPGVILGVIAIRSVDNTGESEGVMALLKEVEAKVKSEFSGTDVVGQHPYISAWRQAYRQFGSDPHEYRCSSEALVRRTIKGNPVEHINKLVDMYNYISLKYITPVGGEDLEKIKGDIVLDFAKGNERFVRLGGIENEPPEVGEVVYKDDIGVLCRRWNWREGDRTKLTEDTKNAIIVIESLPPMGREILEQAINELVELIQKFSGGNQSHIILDNEISSFDVD